MRLPEPKQAQEQKRIVARVLESTHTHFQNTPPSHNAIVQSLKATATKLSLTNNTLDNDHLGNSRLVLHSNALELTIDFTQGDYDHRRRFGGGRKQHLARAIGLHKDKHLRIIDATAGLGKDSFVLASLGADVHMLERSPLLALLLAHGLAHAATTELAPIVERMHVYWGDARDVLAGLESADAIYLDPMYPENDKHALPKKGAQMLRTVAYRDDVEEEEVLECARQHSPKVVVKRPKGAPFLAGLASNQQVQSKNTRYDIYNMLYGHTKHIRED